MTIWGQIGAIGAPHQMPNAQKKGRDKTRPTIRGHLGLGETEPAVASQVGEQPDKTDTAS